MATPQRPQPQPQSQLRAASRPTPGEGPLPNPKRQGIEGNAALTAKGPITGGREVQPPYRHEQLTGALHAAASLHQQHGQYVGTLSSLPSHSTTHGRTPALSDNPPITPEQRAAMRAGAMAGCEQCRTFGRGMNAAFAEQQYHDTEKAGRERMRRAQALRTAEATHEAVVARLLSGQAVAEANVTRGLDQSGKNEGYAPSAAAHPVSGSAQWANKGPATSGLGPTAASPIPGRPAKYNIANVAALTRLCPSRLMAAKRMTTS